MEIIASLFVGIVAIIISILTLKQNSKMIEESTRPYISIYYDYVDTLGYFVIKNVGSSFAIIDSLSCSHKFDENECGEDNPNLFEQIIHANLSPNCSLRLPVIAHNLTETDFVFKVQYHTSTHKYKDEFLIKTYSDVPFPNLNKSVDTPMDALKQIYLTLYEILKHRI